MRADGRFMDQFELYIRRGDQAMRLVEKGTRKPVTIEAIMVTAKTGGGMFVRPVDATGVFLMSDEIIHVDEFPSSRRMENA
jgi:hypothetical protein